MQTTRPSGGVEDGLKVGPIALVPGITHLHASVVVFASLTTISMMVYINIVQPYLLTQVLNVPMSEIGSVTGRLNALHEIIAIACMSVIGALSDQWGRRVIYCVGFLLISAGYFLYPLADTIWQLAIFRAVFAAGTSMALVMFTALAIDISQERSRGKAVGALNLLGGFGVLLMTLTLARIPAMLENAGYDEAVAGRYAFWAASALCFSAAAVIGMGLRGMPDRSASSEGNPLATIAAALKLAARNPKIALTYAAAFIGRGDLAFVGMFIPLWVTQSALTTGMSAGEATARAGTMIFVHQGGVVLFAFIVGLLCDRFNKVMVLASAFGFASLGYFSLWLIGDPFASLTLVGIVFLAMGDTGIVITNNVLAGEQAPAISRGAVLGFLGVFGGIGISILTLIGGEIFDSIGATAPFLMITLLNVVIIAWAVLVVRRERFTIG